MPRLPLLPVIPAPSAPAHDTDLTRVRRAWDTLATSDPLWAVYALAHTRNGGWDPDEFYATGEAEVAAALDRAADLGLMTTTSGRALDFGCGVGRLTRPLARRFDEVCGVDISAEMLALAENDNPYADRCQFVRNDTTDLSQFPDGAFDLVYASIVLQHLRPPVIRGYLTEFTRVVRPGGAIIFNLPVRARTTTFKGLVFRYVPPGAISFAQRRLLRYPAPMEMHGLREAEVRALFARHDAEVLAADPYDNCAMWVHQQYYVRRND